MKINELPVRVACIALWFPKPTETFVLREMQALEAIGLQLEFSALYGPLRRGLSQDMRRHSDRVRRFGLRALPALLPVLVRGLLNTRHRALFVAMIRRRGHSWERWAENLWAYACGLALAPELQRRGVRHIHATWANGPATAAYVASMVSAIPFSFSARARDLYLADGILAEKIAVAAFVRCNNKKNLDYMADRYGHRDKLHCVYNGIQFPLLATARPVPAAPYRLGAVGRLVEKKGYVHLIDACDLLLQRGVDFVLTLIGDGPLDAALRRHTAERGLSSRVRFTGFISQDQMAACYDRMDILIMPSVIDAAGDRDGIPNVLMEACTRAVPIIASDVSAIGELVIDGETGTLVPPKDAESIAAAVEALVADPARARAMATQAQERVRIQFDPEKNAFQLKSLFENHVS